MIEKLETKRFIKQKEQEKSSRIYQQHRGIYRIQKAGIKDRKTRRRKGVNGGNCSLKQVHQRKASEVAVAPGLLELRDSQ